ncbi:hypothetical protein [Peribacillus muralis]|nr:hypothetical protein [Peribacillus muralis]
MKNQLEEQLETLGWLETANQLDDLLEKASKKMYHIFIFYTRLF